MTLCGKGGHSRPLAATREKAATRGHLRPLGKSGHLRPLEWLRVAASGCFLWDWNTSATRRRRPLAVTCGHSTERPLAATCGHSSGCEWLQVAAFLKFKYRAECNPNGFFFLKSGTSPLLAKRVAAVWHLPPDLLFFASASALLQGSYARNRPQASTASLSTLRNRLFWKSWIKAAMNCQGAKETKSVSYQARYPSANVGFMLKRVVISSDIISDICLYNIIWHNIKAIGSVQSIFFQWFCQVAPSTAESLLLELRRCVDWNQRRRKNPRLSRHPPEVSTCIPQLEAKCFQKCWVD